MNPNIVLLLAWIALACLMIFHPPTTLWQNRAFAFAIGLGLGVTLLALMPE